MFIRCIYIIILYHINNIGKYFRKSRTKSGDRELRESPEHFEESPTPLWAKSDVQRYFSLSPVSSRATQEFPGVRGQSQIKIRLRQQ